MNCGLARPCCVVHLGYADSGHGPVLYPDPPDRPRFARADLGEAAAALAGLICEEQADLLLSYDPQGGYGHRDHVKMHEVGARAAEMAGVRVLEVTLPRELVTAARPAPAAAGGPLRPAGDRGRRHSAVGHHAPGERAPVRAAEAGRSGGTSVVQSLMGRSARLARVMLALPVPVFGLMLGREWLAEPGAAAATVSGDILQTVPQRSPYRRTPAPPGT